MKKNYRTGHYKRVQPRRQSFNRNVKLLKLAMAITLALTLCYIFRPGQTPEPQITHVDKNQNITATAKENAQKALVQLTEEYNQLATQYKQKPTKELRQQLIMYQKLITRQKQIAQMPDQQLKQLLDKAGFN